MFKRACSRQLETQLNTLQKDGPAAWAALPEEELFTPAGFSSQQAEATASTSYSYWGSTFRAFFKNKLAVALLAALAAVVVFAFVQPLLPGQADPNLCAVDPATGIQYRNIAPGQQGFLKQRPRQDWRPVLFVSHLSCTCSTESQYQARVKLHGVFPSWRR